MNHPPQDDYLVTQVMTAAPQKLQLMLIEAAIRKAQLCRRYWREEETERAAEALIRAQQIVTELLCSLKVDPQDELVRKVAGIYLFVFRTLVRAEAEQDEQLLDEAIGVLEVERGTWQAVCEQLGVEPQREIAFETESSGTDFEA